MYFLKNLLKENIIFYYLYIEMVNYQNGKIYRIVCNVTGQQYIGSTVSSLNTRLCQHKKSRSCTSTQIIDNNDYSIVLIEDYPCERKEQLLARERFYIETMDCVNKKYPLRSQHEWYEDNKKRLIEKQTIWNNNNKDKLKEYRKTYRNKNKGVYVDLTNIDVEDEEQIKLNIEELYDCLELTDKDILIELIDKNIINKL